MASELGLTLCHFLQAPSNMKSVLQAGWLLTVAVGNIIVLIVAGAGQFSEQVRMQTEVACTSVLSVDAPP